MPTLKLKGAASAFGCLDISANRSDHRCSCRYPGQRWLGRSKAASPTLTRTRWVVFFFFERRTECHRRKLRQQPLSFDRIKGENKWIGLTLRNYPLSPHITCDWWRKHDSRCGCPIGSHTCRCQGIFIPPIFKFGVFARISSFFFLFFTVLHPSF